MALKWPNKDPDEQLDYSIDWSRSLGTSTISSVVWKIDNAEGTKQTWTPTTVVNSLQYVSASNTDTVATIQLGLGTANTNYNIYCQVTTSSGVTTERKINLKVRESN
jgi:hypothetical protein